MLDGLGLQSDCFPHIALPGAQLGQMGIGIGVRWGQADGSAECFAGFGFLVAPGQENPLIGPEERVVWLSSHGTTDDLLSQIEIASMRRLPGLVGQLEGAAAIFETLFLRIHRGLPPRAIADPRWGLSTVRANRMSW